MDSFIGTFKPKNNMRCQVTGRTFGPSTGQKFGYQVTIDRDGEKHTFVTATRETALELVKKHEELNGE